MNHDEIISLFYTHDAIDDDGREFLTNRGLAIPVATKMGIASRNGNIYFAFRKDREVVRYKWRPIAEKKFFSNSLPEKDAAAFKYPFFNQLEAPESKIVVITEGEFDCVAIDQLNAPYAVSLPNGAGSAESAIRNNYQFLQQFEEIYIAFDMDDAGEAAAKKAQALIPAAKYRRLIMPFKDANEWLQEDGKHVDYQSFQKFLKKAYKYKSSNVKEISEINQTYRQERDIGFSSGYPSLDKKIGGLRRGELTVICADTGAGKTTFALNLIINLIKQNQACWVNSYEISKDTILRKLAASFNKKDYTIDAIPDGEADEWEKFSDGKLLVNPNEEKQTSESIPTLENINKDLEYFCYAKKGSYVLFDHLDYISPHCKKPSNHECILETMKTLHDYALRYNVGMLLVVHPQQLKEGLKVTMANLKGSSSIKQYADNVLILNRNERNDPNDKTVNINICKNRLFGIEGIAKLFYNRNKNCYEEIF